MSSPAGSSAPSPLLEEHAELLREAAQRGPVVDLACGRGRIALAAAAQGFPVVGIDRSSEFLRELRSRAEGDRVHVRTVRADLEDPHGLPLATGACSAVLVFRYLHRPLVPELHRVLEPGGLLLYETFTIHQRELGYGPRNADFLLEPGELPRLFTGFRVLHHWEGTTTADERPAATARLVARKP